MGIFDMFRRRPFSQTTALFADRKEPVVLSGEPITWHDAFVQQAGLDRAFEDLRRDVQRIRPEIVQRLRGFTDESVLQAIPDRARTMNALHGKEYASKVNKFLTLAEFTSIVNFGKEQERFLDGLATLRDLQSKNVSILKEFMHDELQGTQALLQELEDDVLAFTKLLAERKYHDIHKVRDVALRLAQHSERAAKYEKLLDSLQADLKRTARKRASIEAAISEQVGLVRNATALEALESVKMIEEELHAIATEYALTAADALTLVRKHPDIDLVPKTKHIIEELSKDALAYLPGHAEDVKEAIDELIQAIENARPGNVRQLVERLNARSRDAERDAATITTKLPRQREIKRAIMGDVAALAMYDKRQFLIRAMDEERTIARKIAYLEDELSPAKRDALRRELFSLARDLGAQIEDEESERTATKAPSAPEEPSPTDEEAADEDLEK
jgi:hypothetical protein